jgi:hypothetical protein
VGACSAPAPDDQSPGPPAIPTTLPLTPADYFGIAWLPSDQVIIAHDSDPLRPGSVGRLWHFAPDGSGFEPLPLDEDPACRRTIYQSPATLPDGRLGFAKGCSGRTGATDLGTLGSRHRYGRSRGAAQPDERLSVLVFVAPGPGIGMVQRGSFICHGIAEMDRSGVRQLDIQVGRRPTGFRLAEAFASQRGTDCPGVGWADQPTWSIGDVAAFFASTEASSLTGQPRLDAPTSLYLWRPGEREATEVISGIRNPEACGGRRTGSRSRSAERTLTVAVEHGSFDHRTAR